MNKLIICSLVLLLSCNNAVAGVRELRPQEVLYAFIGMNYIFDKKAFIEYAEVTNSVPVIMKSWKTKPAISEFKRRFDSEKPYSFYGYSWGVQPARDLILYHGYRPKRFVAVGPYYKVTRLNKIGPTGVRVLIHGDASSGPTYKMHRDSKGRPISHDKIMRHVTELEKRNK